MSSNLTVAAKFDSKKIFRQNLDKELLQKKNVDQSKMIL